MTDLRVWRVGDSDEFEVLDLNPAGEPNTLMISTFERCVAEYPDAQIDDHEQETP
jgi:hypothetical protein